MNRMRWDCRSVPVTGLRQDHDWRYGRFDAGAYVDILNVMSYRVRPPRHCWPSGDRLSNLTPGQPSQQFLSSMIRFFTVNVMVVTGRFQTTYPHGRISDATSGCMPLP